MAKSKKKYVKPVVREIKLPAALAREAMQATK